MKKISIVSIALLLLIFPYLSASAQEDTKLLSQSIRSQNPATTTASKAAQTSTQNNLSTRAVTEIDRRIENLNALKTRIQNSNSLTADLQSNYLQLINTLIADLNSLKTKIQSETDETVLKTYVASLANSYKQFALYMPQFNIISSANRILYLSEEMSTLSAKLQTRINQQKAQGVNTSTLETALADMNSKIKSANSTATSVLNSVTSLTPEGYPANKRQLQSARTQLASARQDLLTASRLAKTIVASLGQSSTTQASASATTPSTSSATTR